MPHQRRSGSPHVVVNGIEGQDTLSEFDLTAAPSREWRAAFLRPPPAMTTADHTPENGRGAVHGSTVHFRVAPQHRVARAGITGLAGFMTSGTPPPRTSG